MDKTPSITSPYSKQLWFKVLKKFLFILIIGFAVIGYLAMYDFKHLRGSIYMDAQINDLLESDYEAVLKHNSFDKGMQNLSEEMEQDKRRIVYLSPFFWPQALHNAFTDYPLFKYCDLSVKFEHGWIKDVNGKLVDTKKLTEAENNILDKERRGLYLSRVRVNILIGNFLAVLFLSLIITYILAKLKPVVYLPCPHKECDKSVKVHEIWRCDLCNNVQKKAKYITDKCDFCHRKLKSAFCEHCEKEIPL